MPTAERQQALTFIAPKTESVKNRIRKVLDGVKKGLTAKEIAFALNVKRVTVTGRIDELWDDGLLYGITVKNYETRYVVADASQRDTVIAARKKEKFHVWLKKGQERYGEVIPEATWNVLMEVAVRNF